VVPPQQRSIGLGAAQDPTDLPEVTQLLVKPQRVLDAVGANLAALRSQLSDAEKKTQHDVAAEANQYETKLASQEHANQDLNLTNYKIKDVIAGIRSRNNDLKANAKALEQEIAGLTADLTRMEANMTTAREFTERQLTPIGNLTDSAKPELQVLTELAVKDKEEARKQRYAEIAGILKPTLLQIRSRTVSKARRSNPATLDQSASTPPSDLLSALRNSLDALAESRTQVRSSWRRHSTGNCRPEPRARRVSSRSKQN
jgi:chromosome segregation ATPase